MKFYRIECNVMFMNRKYAYLSTNKKNEFNDNKDYVVEEHEIYTCPYCGHKNKNLFYPELYYGIFNKDNVGDFSFGVTSYGQLGLSNRAIKLIKEYYLKGVKELKKYISIETTRKAPITSIDNEYYEAKIEFLPLIWKYITDENNNLVTDYILRDNRDEFGCDKCLSNKMYRSLNKNDKLYITGLNEVTLDIFSTTDNKGEIFVSQKFVDMCVKEKLTNITNKFVEVYDSESYK